MTKYYDELVYYVQKMIGDKDKASDIIQETYIKTLEKSKNLEIENTRAFLYRVAKNIVIDKIRKNKKTKHIDYAESVFVSPTNEQPDEIVIANDDYENLIKLVDTLPLRCKEAFVLHNIEGYSRKEIASMMGITVSAVEKLIIRATKKLQEKLC